jgi:hypothetical protein
LVSLTQPAQREYKIDQNKPKKNTLPSHNYISAQLPFYIYLTQPLLVSFLSFVIAGAFDGEPSERLNFFLTWPTVVGSPVWKPRDMLGEAATLPRKGKTSGTTSATINAAPGDSRSLKKFTDYGGGGSSSKSSKK